MTTKKTSFHLLTDNADLIDFLRSQKNIAKFLEALAEKYRIGALVERIDDNAAKELAKIYKHHQIKNIELRNENLTYKNKIEKVKADYAETFGKPASTSAVDAIGKRFEDAKPQTTKQLSINAALRFMESCKLNDLNQWVVICEVCRGDFINENREAALAQFRDHMTAQHQKELLT